MKTERLKAILKIISENDVETQGELAKRLKNAGFDTTQATISRDIRELRLTKELSENGRLKYAQPRGGLQESASPVKKRVLAECVLSVETAGNIVVIKTLSGMAMAAAAALDEWKFEGCVGCIAGDDTVFAAVIPGREEAVVSELEKIIL